jgi:hypothetical protein
VIQPLTARKTFSRRREFLSRGPLVVSDVGAAITRIEQLEPLNEKRLAAAFCVSPTSIPKMVDVSFERMAMRAWCGKSPQVYAVCFEHPRQDSFIKVGYTNDLSKRLPQLIADLLKIEPAIDRSLVQWRQVFGVRFRSDYEANAFEQTLHSHLQDDAVSYGREWYFDTYGVGKVLMQAYCCCVELVELRPGLSEARVITKTG